MGAEGHCLLARKYRCVLTPAIVDSLWGMCAEPKMLPFVTSVVRFSSLYSTLDDLTWDLARTESAQEAAEIKKRIHNVLHGKQNLIAKQKNEEQKQLVKDLLAHIDGVWNALTLVWDIDATILHSMVDDDSYEGPDCDFETEHAVFPPCSYLSVLFTLTFCHPLMVTHMHSNAFDQ